VLNLLTRRHLHPSRERWFPSAIRCRSDFPMTGIGRHLDPAPPQDTVMAPAESQRLRVGGSRFMPALAVSVVAVIVYASWIAFSVGGARTTLVVDDVGNLIAPAVAAVFLLRRARASRDLGWLLVAIWLVLIGLGNLDRAYYEVVLSEDAPFPSLAFGLYFCSTISQVAAIVLMCGRGLGRLSPRLVLDGALVACAILLIGWFGGLGVASETGGGPLLLALALSRPVGDVVTVVIIVSTLSYSRRLERARLLVVLGVLLFVCSDSVLTYLVAAGAALGAALVDAVWFAGFLVVGLASLVESPPGRSDSRPLSRWQVVLPYLPLVVAIGVTLVEWLGHRPLDPFTVLLITGMVVLVLGRQLMAVIEAHGLAAELRDAAELWKEVSAEREVVIENAPVGICRLSPDGRLLTANRALQQILRCDLRELIGRPLRDLLQPDGADSLAAFIDGSPASAGEAQFVRRDQTVIWCSYETVGVAGVAGHADTYISIIEDINERRLDAERAAIIQRRLLPQSTPTLGGYELAGVCLPAQNVAGDFFDWVVAEGHLDVTVADVMGKGMGAALVMAALRTALRATPATLGPARRMALADESMALVLEGLFVTVVQVRLDLGSGRLRYVDAGHGHCALRRADGELVHLSTRSLPLGVQLGAEFAEGELRMEPGDSLILYSDGLVETETGTAQAESLLPCLVGAGSAAEMLERLTGQIPAHLADDVTAVIVRRLPQSPLTRVPDPLHAFHPVPERVLGGEAAVAGQLDVQPDRVARRLEAGAGAGQVVGQQRRVAAAGRDRLLDAAVELLRAADEPDAAPAGEDLGLGHLGHAQQLAVEAARQVLASRGDGDLHVVQAHDGHDVQVTPV
jgi:PAS domain S-box-containing protein